VCKSEFAAHRRPRYDSPRMGRGERDDDNDTVVDISVGIEERPSVLYSLGETQAQALKSGAEKYQTVRLLGRGGMGEVYEVRDQDLRRNVALKRVRPDRVQPQVVARFLEEAQITAQLEHPNIMPIHDLGLLGSGDPFFTMARVEGQTLAQVLTGLDRGDPAFASFDRTRLTIVFLQVAQAVAYAHARGGCSLGTRRVRIS
jgi:serine/threonine protein kinase